MSCFLGNLGTGLSTRLKFCPFPALISADGTWIPSQFTSLLWGAVLVLPENRIEFRLENRIEFRLYRQDNLKTNR